MTFHIEKQYLLIIFIPSLAITTISNADYLINAAAVLAGLHAVLTNLSSSGKMPTTVTRVADFNDW
jgi:hypothetical protein